MRVSLWITIISTCLVGITVDSAIIRDYRKAKLDKDSLLDPERKTLHGGRPHRPKTRRRTFRPTPSRCCKIGYKVAKRKLYCDVQLLEIVRKFNDMQRTKMKYNRPRNVRPTKISAKLSSKLGKCSASYPQFFEKCCKYRDQYYKTLSKCKRRPSRERRKCRQDVRKHFPKNKGGGRSRSRSRGRSKPWAPSRAARGRRKV